MSLIDSTLSFSEIVSVVTNGRNGMPSFSGSLSTAEIDALVRYTREVLSEP